MSCRHGVALSEVFATPSFSKSGLFKVETGCRQKKTHSGAEQKFRLIAETTMSYQTIRIWLQLTRAYLSSQDWPAAEMLQNMQFVFSRR
jgi:hypothetical protein